MNKLYISDTRLSGLNITRVLACRLSGTPSAKSLQQMAETGAHVLLEDDAKKLLETVFYNPTESYSN